MGERFEVNFPDFFHWGHGRLPVIPPRMPRTLLIPLPERFTASSLSNYCQNSFPYIFVAYILASNFRVSKLFPAPDQQESK